MVQQNKSLVTEAKLRSGYDKAYEKREQKKFDRVLANLTKKLSNFEKRTDKHLSTLATGQAKTVKEMRRNKRDFESILELADKNNLKLKEEVKTLEQRLKEQEPCPEGQHRNEEGECVPDEKATEQHECEEGHHWSEDEQKCVPDEVTEMKKKLAETVTKLENLEDKLAGKFKAKTNQLKETRSEYYEDPLKQKRKRKK